MSHKNTIERIMLRVKKAPGCWEWDGGLNSAGYGIAMIDGRSWTVHRYVWTSANGLIPEGMFILHHCDNRKCVNLDHLFIGTNSDNMLDASKKGRLGIQLYPERYRKEKCIRSHDFDGVDYLGRRTCSICISLTKRNYYKKHRIKKIEYERSRRAHGLS